MKKHYIVKIAHDYVRIFGDSLDHVAYALKDKSGKWDIICAQGLRFFGTVETLEQIAPFFTEQMEL